VPFVLNLSTGHVSPQFHVVFDDWFTTLNTDDQDEEESIESSEWAEFLLNQRLQITLMQLMMLSWMING
jgi:hypothetical protein